LRSYKIRVLTLSQDPKHNKSEGKEPQGNSEELTAKEYRLIPVDDNGNSGGNAVNIVELMKYVRDQYRIIAKITGCFLLIGLLIAIFSPVEYTSEALLMPEMKSSDSSVGELLKDYGSILGMGDMGSMDMSSEGTIAPEVYPKIVSSLSFQNQLLEHKVYFANIDTTVSGYTYFKEVKEWSFFELIVEYTLGLPGKISGEKEIRQLPDWLREQFNKNKVIELTKKDLEVIREMEDRIEIELDSGTGVLTVSSQMPDPIAAAQINNQVISILKDFVEEYSTQKAKEDLAFAKEQHKQAKSRFEKVQNKLATFLDQNVKLSTAKSQSEEQRLQAEFDLAYNAYNSISQQLMKAKMDVQEKTPVFKPIQSVNVPNEKSEPKRFLILVLSLIVGIIVSFFFVAGQQIYDQNFSVPN